MGIGRHFESSSDKRNKTKEGQAFRKISWHQCQCSGSSQIPSQDDFKYYHQFLSLYKIRRNNHKTKLIIFNTENRRKKVKTLDAKIKLDTSTSITQLPNGELFCYGSLHSGIALIIDRSYRVKILPSCSFSTWSSALYYKNNIYCFGGCLSNRSEHGTTLSRKFDLEKNKWTRIPLLPWDDYSCHSVAFNENILISGCRSKNLLLYSIEINSFSIIPYDFGDIQKILINLERLYLIEWGAFGKIYESEDEYQWNPVSIAGQSLTFSQIYCLYFKEKVYISAEDGYYEFDLKKKVLVKFEV